jgi:cell division protein FtsB
MFDAIRTKRFLAALIVSLLLFAGYSVFSERGLLELNRLYRHRNALKADVKELERENTRLVREVGLLRNDPVTIENLARTRLDMVRPGEVVYIFPDAAESATP